MGGGEGEREKYLIFNPMGGGGGYSTLSWVSTMKLIEKWSIFIVVHTEGEVAFP